MSKRSIFTLVLIIILAGVGVFAYRTNKGEGPKVSGEQAKIFHDSGIDYDWVLRVGPDYNDPEYLSGNMSVTSTQTVHSLKFRVATSLTAANQDYVKYFRGHGWKLNDRPADLLRLLLFHESNRERLQIKFTSEAQNTVVIELIHFVPAQ